MTTGDNGGDGSVMSTRIGGWFWLYAFVSSAIGAVSWYAAVRPETGFLAYSLRRAWTGAVALLGVVALVLIYLAVSKIAVALASWLTSRQAAAFHKARARSYGELHGRMDETIRLFIAPGSFLVGFATYVGHLFLGFSAFWTVLAAVAAALLCLGSWIVGEYKRLGQWEGHYATRLTLPYLIAAVAALFATSSLLYLVARLYTWMFRAWGADNERAFILVRWYWAMARPLAQAPAWSSIREVLEALAWSIVAAAAVASFAPLLARRDYRRVAGTLIGFGTPFALELLGKRMETAYTAVTAVFGHLPVITLSLLFGLLFEKVAGLLRGRLEEKMGCPRCGFEIESPAHFCPHCGTDLEAPQAAPHSAGDGVSAREAR